MTVYGDFEALTTCIIPPRDDILCDVALWRMIFSTLCRWLLLHEGILPLSSMDVNYTEGAPDISMDGAACTSGWCLVAGSDTGSEVFNFLKLVEHSVFKLIFLLHKDKTCFKPIPQCMLQRVSPVVCTLKTSW